MTPGPRIVIIGNSGSGKTTLARRLEGHVVGARIDLDDIHWLDKVGVKRDEGEARELVAGLATEPVWIIEGVFGWLAEAAFARATSLIWLDMSREVCRDSLAQRGPQRGASSADHAALIAWADDYWQRTTSSSFTGHLALFDRFTGTKIRLRQRGEVDDLLAKLT